eukprot:356747-Chlamydomonas_euryale.AAC.4
MANGTCFAVVLVGLDGRTYLGCPIGDVHQCSARTGVTFSLPTTMVPCYVLQQWHRGQAGSAGWQGCGAAASEAIHDQ